METIEIAAATGARRRGGGARASLALVGPATAALADAWRASALSRGATPAAASAPAPPPRHPCGLRRRGVTYDTGALRRGGSSHEPFDPELVGREMRVIAGELGCNAVRITGELPERLGLAATLAAAAGLEVWCSPLTTELGSAEAIELLAACAEECEHLRRAGHRVVLVAGAELSLAQHGFLPGATRARRIAGLTPANPQLPALLAALPERVDAFFGRALPLLCERFGGPVTYSSLPFERVDWGRFDFVAAGFRPNLVGGRYLGAEAALAELASHGKPVAITELGCCAHAGAAANAGCGGEVVVRDPVSSAPLRLAAGVVPSEGEQAHYLVGLLELLAAAGVDAAFASTFAERELPGELDAGSHSLVRLLPAGETDPAFPGLPWEPKQAFRDLAAHFGGRRGRRRRRWLPF